MKLTQINDTFNRLFQLNIKLINYDPNEDNRGRYRYEIKDSFTRAMSAVLHTSYEDVLEEQFKTAAFLRCDSNHISVIDFMMEKHGYSIFKFEKPYSVLTFILNNPKGSYVINTDDGALAVINANVVDIVPKDISGADYLEKLLCRMITRVYELKPEDERPIFTGEPGKDGSIANMAELEANANVKRAAAAKNKASKESENEPTKVADQIKKARKRKPKKGE